MAQPQRRREMIDAFKNRKPNGGVFALRCESASRVWVGSSMDLNAERNKLFFSLRQSMHRDTALQTAWNDYGEASFAFEVLQKLDEDLLPMAVRDTLKERSAFWSAQLNAPILLP